jgi:heat shock protein HslJ
VVIRAMVHLRPAATYLRAIGVGLACVALASCGSGAGGLNGTKWKLSGWTLNSLDPSAFTITAAFSDGQISGKSAVNTYSGPYTASSDGAFSVGQLATTLMAGPEPAMRAEHAYVTLLQQARSYSLKGQTLTLFDENGNESLIFAKTGG